MTCGVALIKLNVGLACDMSSWVSGLSLPSPTAICYAFKFFSRQLGGKSSQLVAIIMSRAARDWSLCDSARLRSVALH